MLKVGIFSLIISLYVASNMDKNFIRDTLINVRTGKHVRAPARPKYISKTVLRHTLKEVDVLEKRNLRVNRKKKEAEERRKKWTTNGLTILEVITKIPTLVEIVKFLLSLLPF